MKLRQKAIAKLNYSIFGLSFKNFKEKSKSINNVICRKFQKVIQNFHFPALNVHVSLILQALQ